MSAFTHLHLHTHYSLSEGLLRVSRLPEILKAKNFNACAITDTGNMYGVIDFYSRLKSHGIKPIIGTQIYLSKDNINSAKKKSPWDITYFEIVLLCKNNQGYQNLIKLSSLAFTGAAHNGIPEINDKLLAEYSDGLIMLSGGLNSKINHLIEEDNLDEALNEIEFYRSIFKEQYFLELQTDGHSNSIKINNKLVEFSSRLNIPCVATNNCRYETREDAYPAHILMLMGQQKNISDHPQPYTTEFYLKSEDEMRQTFSEYPEECISNTRYIADMCDVNLDKKKNHLPDFPCVEGNTPIEQFKDDCKKGLDIRCSVLARVYNWSSEAVSKKREQYFKRLEYEMEIIINKGFPGYFLIVADFVKWAKDRNIPVGPGRGSGAGSIAAYALRITDIDPIKYDLLFERFLNPERYSMPDFDIDFEASGRDRVIDYVREKYGNEKVCQISAIGTLQAKGAVRGVARVLDISYGAADKIVKLIPSTLNITLDKALEEVQELRTLLSEGSEPDKKLISISMSLEGAGSNLTTHAAGVIIMNSEVSDHIPVCVSPQGIIQSQYPMEFLESQGAIKFDFLGLRNLSIIDETIKLIESIHNKKIDFDTLDFNDDKVFELLREGNSTGIFQLESEGMQNLLRDLKPDCFEDIVALVALYRPGPIGSGMITDFTKRKNGKQRVEYIHPLMEETLRETYGVMVYQEQVMRIAQVMGNFTLGQADNLRKAMGKKNQQILNEQKDIFVKGCANNNIDPKIAQDVFDLIDKFAGYGFNKSHSVGYAVIGYQTAYLKTYYPIEFMCTLLNFNKKTVEDMVNVVNQCRKMNIAILPPDVNKSMSLFTVEEDSIRFGISAIKAVQGVTLVSINNARKNDEKFTSMESLLISLKGDIKFRSLIALIKAGTLDSIHPNRKELLENIDLLMDFIEGAKEYSRLNQDNLFDVLKETFDIKDEFEAKLDLKKTKDWDKATRLLYERETIGLAVSGHVLDDSQYEFEQLPKIKNSIQLNELTKKLLNESENEASPQVPVLFFCIVSSIVLRTTNTGKIFANLILEDKWGELEGVIWPKFFEKLQNNLFENKPMVVKGNLTRNKSYINISVFDFTYVDEYRLRNANYIKLMGAFDKKDNIESFINKFQVPTGEGIKLLLETKYKDSFNAVFNTGEEIKKDKEVIDYIEKQMDIQNIEYIYTDNDFNLFNNQNNTVDKDNTVSKSTFEESQDNTPVYEIISDIPINI